MRHITTNTSTPTPVRGIADISWHARGACRNLEAAEADRLFFSAPRAHRDIAEAKTVCAPCPVRQDCFTHALDNDVRWGMWGGLTETERRPWHAKVAKRLDYARVRAAIMGRDVFLTAAERDAVARHAYVRGWTPERLAYVLAVDLDHARDLLRDAGHAVADRDRYWATAEADDSGAEATEETFCLVPRQEQTDELIDALRKAA
ncbi:WhiB family transcriptional regulator [Streptomyces sp. NPDC054835]|uniref:WhiB family transcriptional regulator n=1 Tax=Streptomyces exfoliatus TaxID=1905 RepID=UPI000465E29B|nr:WhiB family transcriptional regulator [Streptomyces exfoliatus]